MEDLKAIITLIKDLPALTVWVLAGYLVYRLAVVGSIYGVIRLAITRLFDWLQHPKTVEATLEGLTISSRTTEDLIVQLRRLRTSTYIHDSGVEKLRKALDDAGVP
jgi:hypothetical protein